MKTLIIWLLIAVGLFWGGFNMQQSQNAYRTAELRQVVMVDAWDEYNESGRHLFKGVFVDKKEGTRFDWAIEPNTFREFERTGSQRDMQLVASHWDVNGMKGSEATNFFGIMFMCLAVLIFGCVFVGFFAALFDW